MSRNTSSPQRQLRQTQALPKKLMISRWRQNCQPFLLWSLMTVHDCKELHSLFLTTSGFYVQTTRICKVIARWTHKVKRKFFVLLEWLVPTPMGPGTCHANLFVSGKIKSGRDGWVNEWMIQRLSSKQRARVATKKSCTKHMGLSHHTDSWLTTCDRAP